MRKELKKFPKEMQDAYAKVPKKPDENTPSAILEMLGEDVEAGIAVLQNQFKLNTIIDYADANLLELDLDVREKKPSIYNEFALEVAKKIGSFVDIDLGGSKPCELYDNNPKVTRLKVKDFTKLGDLSGKTKLEKADIFAEHYGILENEEYVSLSTWEKKLFADKVESRADTSLEKK